MRRRLGTVLGLVLALSVAVPWAAFAQPPIVLVDERYDGITELDPFLSDACGFDVYATLTGRYRETLYLNRDGSFQKLMAHPSFQVTLSSPYGEFTSADRGLDKFTLNPDEETFLIHGTGIHLRVKGEAYAIGLWRLTIDIETGELVEQQYHGRFDLQEPEIADWICQRLGPD
jgi:hypothetical protein